MLEGIGGLPSTRKSYRFGVKLAYKSCMVNDTDFDPARCWGLFGGSTPHLIKIAMRILSLTSSSSGCERNWSTFEAVHTKKRNRLETIHRVVKEIGARLKRYIQRNEIDWRQVE
ncbi:unnamed protein product [Lactuca saligna]|uniref:HAT C-terminal dimerisation domain-containing protein n=1 Tax=Lactuca saligna TaxID=75948 RepID=A0AA35ZND8_LACSI|nr:unnamed protein product [Lactuca saligna]